MRQQIILAPKAREQRKMPSLVVSLLHLSISNYTRFSNVSVFGNAFKSLYVHMCVCVE